MLQQNANQPTPSRSSVLFCDSLCFLLQPSNLELKPIQMFGTSNACEISLGVFLCGRMAINLANFGVGKVSDSQTFNVGKLKQPMSLDHWTPQIWKHQWKSSQNHAVLVACGLDYWTQQGQIHITQLPPLRAYRSFSIKPWRFSHDPMWRFIVEKVGFLTCCTMEAEFPCNSSCCVAPLAPPKSLIFLTHFPPLSSTGYIERDGSLASSNGSSYVSAGRIATRNNPKLGFQNNS